MVLTVDLFIAWSNNYFKYFSIYLVVELIKLLIIVNWWKPSLFAIFIRYLLENISWLTEEIGDYEDDYWIFDCPGIFLRLN
jgi:hypothetical protein